METELSVTDFRGQKQGTLVVKVSPCHQDGTLPSEAEDDLFVEDPNDLVYVYLLCMHVCMYVCTYVHMYVYMHVCMCVCMNRLAKQ